MDVTVSSSPAATERARRTVSAQEFLRSIPLERPGSGLDRATSALTVDHPLMSVLDPTSAIDQAEAVVEAVTQRKRPLFANCPRQGIGQTRTQWERSMTPHVLGSRIMVGRYGGSPMIVTSVMAHKGSVLTAPLERRASVDRHGPVDPDVGRLELEPGQTGVSYRALLDPQTSNLFLSLYSPKLLDDPDAKLGSNRLIMNLPCYMSSVIAFVRSKDLRLDLNQQFRLKHPWLPPSMTLSKLRSVKAKILRVIVELEMEVSTAAIAVAYFEMLVIKGSVRKETRHSIAAVCLMLASKFNPSGSEHKDLLETLCEVFRVRRQTLINLELFVFVQLEFNLHLAPSQILPHFSYLLQSMDSDVVEYLGRHCYEHFCMSLGMEPQ
ncbi:Cyclin-like domain-containing protein [Plasmodiophora brassicae]